MYISLFLLFPYIPYSLNTNISLDQGFNPAVTDYTATVVNEITLIDVNAVVAEGAVLGTITGNTNLIEGTNVITIPVTTTEGKSVNYTISTQKHLHFCL